MAPAYVYTDPACPWSWAAEPALRALETHFGDGLEVRFVMGGLAREFARPLETMRQWIDASAASGMPVDPRLWLDAAPRSSYPSCLAVKAAAEQGLDGAFLRRAREGFAYERRSLDSAEPLVELARTVPGLDVERFRVDLSSHAILEAFGADLDRAADDPVDIFVNGSRIATGRLICVDETDWAVRLEEVFQAAEPPTTPEGGR